MSTLASTTTYNFEVSRELPADPATIYRAWRSSEGHSAEAGSTALKRGAQRSSGAPRIAPLHGERTRVTIAHFRVPID